MRPARRPPTRPLAATAPPPTPSAPPRVPGTPIASDGRAPPLLQRALTALFKFPPVLEAAAARARATIRERGLAVGVDVEAEAQALATARDWDALRATLENADIVYPPYYVAPFHCYPDGNLNWDAAFQAYAASAAVHAAVMSPPGVSPPSLSRDGDAALRSSFSDAARALLAEAGVDPDALASAVDLGCSVGLSTRELARAFPRLVAAEGGGGIVGVDLSPHMLAVAAHTGAPAARLIHAPAEATGLPDASVDYVSMCLVSHECPAAATAAIFAEARRVLRPGGALATMDMDTGAPAFAAIVANPPAFAGFSASEPHLGSYMTLHPRQAALDAGFTWAATASNSPRHYTLVAVK